MTYKQLALVLLVVLTSLFFATQPKTAEVGIVRARDTISCAEAKRDLLAVGSRLTHLRDEYAAETGASFRFIMRVESQAVFTLGQNIRMWISENCKAT